MLKIASTGKDPASGKLVTHEYCVEGPVMIFLTTTAQEIDEELINRSIVLMVNEDRAQTQAIHKKQREAQTIEGLWARRQRTTIVKLHRNAQRLLRPIEVVNNHVHDETGLPRLHDADAARSHEVPDAGERDRAAPPISAPGEDGHAERGNVGVHRGHERRCEAGDANWYGKCWGHRSMSYPRKRGGCCC